MHAILPWVINTEIMLPLLAGAPFLPVLISPTFCWKQKKKKTFNNRVIQSALPPLTVSNVFYAKAVTGTIGWKICFLINSRYWLKILFSLCKVWYFQQVEANIQCNSLLPFLPEKRTLFIYKYTVLLVSQSRENLWYMSEYMYLEFK